MNVSLKENNNFNVNRLLDLPLYTPEAVAEKLSVSPRSVTKWLREQKLRGVKIGRLWRIRPVDLADFIDPVDNGHVDRILDSAPIDESILSNEERQALKEAGNETKHKRGIIVSDVLKLDDDQL